MKARKVPTVTLVLGAIASAAVLCAAQGGLAQRPGNNDSQRDFLVVDGKNLGQVLSFRAGRTSNEPITLQIGMSQSKALLDWINLSFAVEPTRTTGVIHACNAQYESMAMRELQSALITEITLPALDGGSKDPASITVKIQPESAKTRAGSGKIAPSPEPPAQKTWLPCNFRVRIGDLPCKRVSKVEAFTIKQSVARNQPAATLQVVLAKADASAWVDWHNDFLVKGNSTASKELTGSIIYLGADMNTELGTAQLRGIGILSLAPERDSRGRETGNVVAKLTARSVRLAAGR